MISYIMYSLENDIKLELTKMVVLSDGLGGRLYNYYNANPNAVEEHLQLIPQDIKDIVNKRIDDEREYIEKHFGGC